MQGSGTKPETSKLHGASSPLRNALAVGLLFVITLLRLLACRFALPIAGGLLVIRRGRLRWRRNIGGSGGLAGESGIFQQSGVE